MVWFLGVSVVLNILLALGVACLVYGVITAQNEAFHNHQEWSKWELRWYEAQAIVSEKLDHHLSPSGLQRPVEIKKHKQSR